MSRSIDATHDPALRSWVESANAAGVDFPIQNLPFGVFRRPGSETRWGVGVAIGNQVLSLGDLATQGPLAGLDADLVSACQAADLAPLMSLERQVRAPLRARLSGLLSASEEASASPREPVARALVPMAEAEMGLPAPIRDYTDFYASIFHATNVGKLFRPDNPLLPNYKHVPIAYHGRSSSIVVSGSAVRRPQGQSKPPESEAPSFGPCRLLDYELELGFLVGPGNTPGSGVPIAQAEDHIFGFCLVNDWSARDIQAWEYQPLGPFLSKSFATSLSPWVVTLEALAPFRCPAFPRPEGDPEPLPHLSSDADKSSGGIDVALELRLRSERMRVEGREAARLTRGFFRDMYWTAAQMLTHHTSNGCELRAGDLLASGTVSGPDPGSGGCLLELTSRGSKPIPLPGGEQRRFLEDGDEVILSGYCERPGRVRIGFGECRGVVLPASP